MCQGGGSPLQQPLVLAYFLSSRPSLLRREHRSRVLPLRFAVSSVPEFTEADGLPFRTSNGAFV
jgi:hypothetical protein